MEKKTNNPYGVILAGGGGKRIEPLSFKLPKPLLPVCNKPIIQYQVEYMMGLGISNFLIVVHHLKEKIMDFFDRQTWRDVQIKFIDQKQPLGIAHALAVLEPYLDAPFLLFLGDIFLVPKNLRRIMKLHGERKAAAILAVKRESDLANLGRNFGVIRDDYGLVKRVIEKPRHLKTDLKGCGVYFFDLSIFDAVRRTPRTAMRDEYEITSAIQILIDDGYPVYAAEVVAWDMNVTVPQDLLICNLRHLQKMGGQNIIGDRVSINPDATIINSIIGDDVRIVNPAAIENSLVFPHSVITPTRPMRNAIITPEQIYKEEDIIGVRQ